MSNLPAIEWRNRIVRYGTMPANEFLANPANARRHPVAQREALRGSFDVLGIIAPVLVNAKTSFVLDGHARIEECLSRDENMLIPFIEVDLTEDEEALALASFDWITQMAYYDRPALESLLDGIDTDNAALQSLLSDMAKDHGLIDLINPMDEWQGMPEFEQEQSKPYHSLTLNFKTETDMINFSKLVNQTIRTTTTYLYYPKSEHDHQVDFTVRSDEP